MRKLPSYWRTVLCFFSGPGDRRILYSFPTRRSSDLPGRYQPRTRMDEQSLAELAQSIRSQGLLQPLVVRIDCASSADRKSTRLNSSHLGISYAVFCLTKKKHLSTSESGIRCS